MTEEQIDDYNGAPPEAPADQVQTVLEYATPLFAEAFRRHGRGERIIFQLTTFSLPSPPNPNAPVNPETGQPDPNWNPMLLLYAEIHGIIPQTRIFNSWPMAPHAWTQAKADMIVQQVLPVLLGYRSQQLEDEERLAQQAMANGNGRPAPPSGLIIPGR